MDGCVEVKSTVAKPWTSEEDAKLKELWLTQTSYQLADFFGRSRMSIVGRANRLGMQKRPTPPKDQLMRPKSENFGIVIKRKVFRPVRPSIETEAMPFIGIPFMELQRNHCRYMKGNLFCGHDKKEGSSYCPNHHSRMCMKLERIVK